MKIPKLNIMAEKEKKVELSQIEETTSRTPRSALESNRNSIGKKFSQHATPALGLKAKLLQIKKENSEKRMSSRRSNNTKKLKEGQQGLQKYASRDHLRNFTGNAKKAKKKLNLFSKFKLSGHSKSSNLLK